MSQAQEKLKRSPLRKVPQLQQVAVRVNRQPPLNLSPVLNPQLRSHALPLHPLPLPVMHPKSVSLQQEVRSIKVHLQNMHTL